MGHRFCCRQKFDLFRCARRTCPCQLNVKSLVSLFFRAHFLSVATIRIEKKKKNLWFQPPIFLSPFTRLLDHGCVASSAQRGSTDAAEIGQTRFATYTYCQQQGLTISLTLAKKTAGIRAISLRSDATAVVPIRPSSPMISLFNGLGSVCLYAIECILAYVAAAADIFFFFFFLELYFKNYRVRGAASGGSLFFRIFPWIF